MAWCRPDDKPLSELLMAFDGDTYMRHSALMSWFKPQYVCFEQLYFTNVDVSWDIDIGDKRLEEVIEKKANGIFLLRLTSYHKLTEGSKPRVWELKSSDHIEIWQASRQHWEVPVKFQNTKINVHKWENDVRI